VTAGANNFCQMGKKKSIFGHLIDFLWLDYKIRFVVGIIGVITVFIARQCNPSTYTDLGSNYTYSNGYIVQIYGKNLNLKKGGEIPSNVISYNYNRRFIVAKQKPKEYDEAWETEYIYPLGRDTVYYWLIIKGKKEVLGPLDNIQFCEEINKHKVPDRLVRKMNKKTLLKMP